MPHQANIRIIDAAAKRMGLPPEKVFVNVDRYGNTSAASIPIALYEAWTIAGRLKAGRQGRDRRLRRGPHLGRERPGVERNRGEARVLCFPGQGAQSVGMGRDLYESDSCGEARRSTPARPLCPGLLAVCFDGPEETLKETRLDAARALCR